MEIADRIFVPISMCVCRGVVLYVLTSVDYWLIESVDLDRYRSKAVGSVSYVLGGVVDVVGV